MACRAATSSFDRAATTLAVGRPAGGSEISVLATSNSSRASGNNASTPTRLAAATREAHATKRKFEYKAHLLRSEFWPPIRRKNNAAVAGLCPRKGTGPAEIETVLNGRPGRKRRFLQRRWIARSAPRGFGERRRPTRRCRLRHQERYARKHHDARAPNRSPGAGRSCTTSRRKRNSAAGRPPVAVEVSPVGSTRAAVSTKRRKFCLCRWRPEIASTVRCSSVRVNSRA